MPAVYASAHKVKVPPISCSLLPGTNQPDLDSAWRGNSVTMGRYPWDALRPPV